MLLGSLLARDARSLRAALTLLAIAPLAQAGCHQSQQVGEDYPAEASVDDSRDSGVDSPADGASDTAKDITPDAVSDVERDAVAEGVTDAVSEEASETGIDATALPAVFTTWFDNASHPAVRSVVPLVDGGFLSVAGGGRGLVTKLDDTGEVLWEKRYAGTLGEEFYSAIRNGSSLFLAGTSRTWGGTSLGSAWLLKASVDGVVATQRALQVTSATARGELFGVAFSGNGLYAVGSLGNRALFLKTDSALNLAWQHSLLGSSNIYDRAEARAVVTTPGGIVAVGSTHTVGTLDESIWVVAVSEAGQIQWQYRYASGNSDSAYAVDSTSDGGFVVGGVHSSAAWVGKSGAAGELQWARSFGNKDLSRINAIKQTSKGTYIAAGETWSTGKGSDAWVLELGSTGDILWQKAYGGPSNDSATAVLETAGGQYVVAGVTSSFGGETPNGFVARLGADGSVPDGCPLGFVTSTAAVGVSLTDAEAATSIGEDPQQASLIDSKVTTGDVLVGQGRICGD